MERDDITEVADGVHAVRGRLVNWYLLREGGDLTLVDAGYPGDVADVLASVRLLGHSPQDVRAVLVTHAHADHLGALAALHAAHGTPAHVGAGDLDTARTGRLEQVALPAVLTRAWQPGVAAWALAAVRRGGRRVAPAPHAQPLPPTGAVLDLPGRPVPVHTGGHTPGHTAVHLPHLGVVLTGDALVTGHPTSRRRGPQLLPGMFSASATGAGQALDVLAALDADVVLPGHGEPLRGPVRDAVDRALAPARRAPTG